MPLDDDSIWLFNAAVSDGIQVAVLGPTGEMPSSRSISAYR